MALRTIEEVLGYKDINEQFHVCKEDALIASLESILNECSTIADVELNAHELVKHKDELMSLLTEFYEEMQEADA